MARFDADDDEPNIECTIGIHPDALPLVRGYGFDFGCESSMSFRVDRPVPHLGARRVLAKEVVASPVPRRSDGSWDKSAAAVRAHVFQDVFDARLAKCALVGADTCFRRVGRQRFVAIFTSRSEFQHVAPFFSVTADETNNRRAASHKQKNGHFIVTPDVSRTGRPSGSKS